MGKKPRKKSAKGRKKSTKKTTKKQTGDKKGDWRVPGFSPMTRVESKAEARYGHAITHSRQYQETVGSETAKKEHDHLVKHYIQEHKSPYKSRVRESESR